MDNNLLPKFAKQIEQLSAAIEADERFNMEEFTEGTKSVRMVYAPFDHVNKQAKIVIVGMTPGAFQAKQAHAAACEALKSGVSISEASKKAKVFASFSGEPMRGNLIKMLDYIGVNQLLGIDSTSSLWTDKSAMVHFTSALRYPVFVDGKNWSGQPDMVRTPRLKNWLETYTGAELKLLPDALIVPLGPKVASAMLHLADQGMIDGSRILDGLPHPSGANAERIAYFVDEKPADLCSIKVNTSKLDTARDALCARVSLL